MTGSPQQSCKSSQSFCNTNLVESGLARGIYQKDRKYTQNHRTHMHSTHKLTNKQKK